MYIVSFFEIADGIDEFSISKEEDLGIHASRAPFPAAENAGIPQYPCKDLEVCHNHGGCGTLPSAIASRLRIAPTSPILANVRTMFTQSNKPCHKSTHIGTHVDDDDSAS